MLDATLVHDMEFPITSLVVVLIPGTGVVYTVSSSVGGSRLVVFAVYASAAILDLVLAAPAARRWIERAFVPS